MKFDTSWIRNKSFGDSNSDWQRNEIKYWITKVLSNYERKGKFLTVIIAQRTKIKLKTQEDTNFSYKTFLIIWKFFKSILKHPAVWKNDGFI